MSASSSSMPQVKPSRPRQHPRPFSRQSYGTNWLTPRKLYAAHYEWFCQQREQLSQFLALTAGQPRAMFSLPKPASYTSTQLSPGSQQPRATTTNLTLSRAELLNLMREAIDDFEARKLAHTRRLLLSTQFAPITIKRWEARLTGKRRSQLTQQVERLCKVYLCLARGIVETKLIAGQLDASYTTAQAYKLHLLNAVLGGLLVNPASPERAKSG